MNHNAVKMIRGMKQFVYWVETMTSPMVLKNAELKSPLPPIFFCKTRFSSGYSVKSALTNKNTIAKLKN
jgi:hypothetical protein